jgi:hypothetical protein
MTMTPQVWRQHHQGHKCLEELINKRDPQLQLTVERAFLKSNYVKVSAACVEKFDAHVTTLKKHCDDLDLANKDGGNIRNGSVAEFVAASFWPTITSSWSLGTPWFLWSCMPWYHSVQFTKLALTTHPHLHPHARASTCGAQRKLALVQFARMCLCGTALSVVTVPQRPSQ